jgi:hypothetical protein
MWSLIIFSLIREFLVTSFSEYTDEIYRISCIIWTRQKIPFTERTILYISLYIFCIFIQKPRFLYKYTKTFLGLYREIYTIFEVRTGGPDVFCSTRRRYSNFRPRLPILNLIFGILIFRSNLNLKFSATSSNVDVLPDSSCCIICCIICCIKWETVSRNQVFRFYTRDFIHLSEKKIESVRTKKSNMRKRCCIFLCIFLCIFRFEKLSNLEFTSIFINEIPPPVFWGSDVALGG